eukprot:TRINITY_DN44996_c0_g1_i1.p1 TRINITY_DN44996_c0_g1~~TRINITY_DN44996_c0_g1_i1.p1  ORF type:complete len:208 (+),score=23.63 TRINITY_DN44996_c0_g1_i1:23-625(+)
MDSSKIVSKPQLFIIDAALLAPDITPEVRLQLLERKLKLLEEQTDMTEAFGGCHPAALEYKEPEEPTVPFCASPTAHMAYMDMPLPTEPSDSKKFGPSFFTPVRPATNEMTLSPEPPMAPSGRAFRREGRRSGTSSPIELSCCSSRDTDPRDQLSSALRTITQLRAEKEAWMAERDQLLADNKRLRDLLVQGAENSRSAD